MEVEIKYHDAVMCAGRWHNISVFILRGNLKSEHVQRMEQLWAELILAYPNKIGSCAFLSAGIPIPSRDTMSQMPRVLKLLNRHAVKMMAIIEDQGVVASMLRSSIRIRSLLVGGNLVGGSTWGEAVPVLASVTQLVGVESPTEKHLRTYEAKYRAMYPSVQETRIGL